MPTKTFTRRRLLAAATLSPLVIAPASQAADTATQRQVAAAVQATVDAALRPLLQAHNIPGMAVAVTLRGQRHFFNYGVASKASGQPVTRDTLFELGSVSKTFTATLGAYAQATGKLKLSDMASQHLPALRGSAFDHISLLDLATYSAGGLPLQFPDAVEATGDMLGYFKNWQPEFAPGTRRRYSNPSIGLFGHLAAHSMGQPFAALLEKTLFLQLGLTHTYVKVPRDEMKRYAQGYNKTGQPVRVGPGLLDAEAYGVKSSAADMIKFVEANMNPARLEAPLQRAIAATHTGYLQVGDMTQGLGWEMYPYPITLERLLAGNSTQMSMQANDVTRLNPPRAPQGDVLMNKTGSTNGFGAYVALVPARGAGVVVLANRNFPIEARVRAVQAVMGALLGRD